MSLKYSIKDLENFTKIKAHTIRIWEQRYGLLSPQRTETNIRYYSEDDLKKILNISLLYNNGLKISKIGQLSEKEIIDKSKSIILKNNNISSNKVIDSLTLFILDFKGEKILKVIEDELEKSSLIEVYELIFIPLLQKIGSLWQVNTISVIHEHYFSTIFRQFLISEINKVKVDANSSKSALLFLHEQEEHEFSILMFSYILKQKGYSCHYFGQKGPIKEIVNAHEIIQPNLVVSTFTAVISDHYFNKVFETLEEMSLKSKVLVSGGQLTDERYTYNDKILRIDSIKQLQKILG